MAPRAKGAAKPVRRRPAAVVAAAVVAASVALKKRPAAAVAGAASKRPASAAAAAADGTVWDHVAASTRGSWVLSTAAVRDEAITHKGNYLFCKRTGNLKEQGGRLVARMVMDRLIPPVRSPGSIKVKPVMPTVVSSEIIQEIHDPENAGAFFVLPSQFNGAEYPCFTETVELIGHYLFDRTGGPRGQLAVHPAVGQFILDNAAQVESPEGTGIDVSRWLRKSMARLEHARDEEGVIDPSQRKFRVSMKMENGYLQVPRLEDAVEEAALRRLRDHLESLYTLAALDVPVEGLVPELDDWGAGDHRVNVVYGSSVPVNTYNNMIEDDAPTVVLRQQQGVSQILMRGAYAGALKLALDYHNNKEVDGRTKVFLMPLGGGVFNNSPSSIALSIWEALEDVGSFFADEKDPHLSEKLDVRVLTWEGKPEEMEVFRHALEALQGAEKVLSER